MFFVFLVCAICDGRQHICENLGRLRHFSVLIYLFILIQVLQVFLFETISDVQNQLHRKKTSVLFPFPYVPDHKHIYFEVACVN